MARKGAHKKTKKQKIVTGLNLYQQDVLEDIKQHTLGAQLDNAHRGVLALKKGPQFPAEIVGNLQLVLEAVAFVSMEYGQSLGSLAMDFPELKEDYR
jgi:hypothetical protein